jgi:hypothetical protein
LQAGCVLRRQLAQKRPNLRGAVIVVQSAVDGEQVGARFVFHAGEISRRRCSEPEVVGDARALRPIELSQRPADVRRAQPKSNVCCSDKYIIFIINLHHLLTPSLVAQLLGHTLEFVLLLQHCDSHSPLLAEHARTLPKILKMQSKELVLQTQQRFSNW